jgi:hypothetical protein
VLRKQLHLVQLGQVVQEKIVLDYAIGLHQPCQKLVEIVCFLDRQNFVEICLEINLEPLLQGFVFDHVENLGDLGPQVESNIFFPESSLRYAVEILHVI